MTLTVLRVLNRVLCTSWLRFALCLSHSEKLCIFWWKVTKVTCHLDWLYQGYTATSWFITVGVLLGDLAEVEVCRVLVNPLPPFLSILFSLEESYHTEPMEICLLFTSLPKVGISESYFLFSAGYSGHSILPFHCSSIPQGLAILIQREHGRECLLLKALAWKWYISLPLTFHMTLFHLPNLIAREARTYGRAGCPGKGGNGFEGNACSITTSL